MNVKKIMLNLGFDNLIEDFEDFGKEQLINIDFFEQVERDTQKEILYKLFEMLENNK